MRVVVLFDPDETCVDPKDTAQIARRHYDLIEPSQDAILMWREYGDEFTDGFRTHIVGNGVFENVTIANADGALAELLELEPT